MAHTLTDEKAKDAGHPDGAKPGDAAASDKHAFNADERAQAREGAPVTIGGIVYHRRRKNWEATRALRRLLREQEHAINKARRLGRAIDALPVDDDATEDKVLDLEKEIDYATDVSDLKAYEIIALLLRTGRDGTGDAPTIEQLQEHLDVEDAGDLAANLAGGGEVDPTPTTPSTSSS